MKQTLVYLFSVLSSFSFVSSSPFYKRQTSADAIEQYITHVRTVVYVLESIRAGNASTSCADADLPARLDNEGYAGEYAQRLLCEVAVGIDIFPDVDLATDHMNTVLEALERAQESGSGTALRCDAVDVDTLDDAGLNGTGIRDAVCGNVRGPASTSTLTTSTSDSGVTTTASSSEETPTSTDTDLGLPTFSAGDTFTTIDPTTLAPTLTGDATASTTSSDLTSTDSSTSPSSPSDPTSTAASGEGTTSPTDTQTQSSTTSEATDLTSSTANTTSTTLSASSTSVSSSPSTTTQIISSTVVLPPISVPQTSSSPTANATNVSTITVRVTATTTVNVTTTLTPTRPPWYWPGPWQGRPTYRYGPYGPPWGTRSSVTTESDGTVIGPTTIASPSISTEVAATTTCTEE